MLHFLFSKVIQYEGGYARGEFTATTFLEKITELYGVAILTRSSLWNKPKKARDEINEAINDEDDLERTPDELLDEALNMDQDREALLRARRLIGRSFRDDLIDWDFNFAPLPPTKDRHDPHKERVKICWKCEEELHEEFVTSCGCQGYCKTCLDRALGDDALCLNSECNRPFHMVIELKNTMKTASREMMELQRMSQDQRQLQQDEEEDDRDRQSDSDNSLHTDVDLLSNRGSSTEEDDQSNGQLSDDDFQDVMDTQYITPPLTKAGEENTGNYS